MSDENEVEEEVSEEQVGSPDGENTQSSELESAAESDWRDMIHDARLRNTVEKYNSLDDMVKAHNHLGGELRNRVRLPDASSSDEEVAAYREHVGVPEDPADYVLPEVEGYEYSEQDYADLESWAEWAQENNIPNDAFMDLVRNRIEQKDSVDRELAKMVERDRELAENQLHEKWGNDYEANIEYAARAAHAFGGEEFVDALEEIEIDGGMRLGDHPAMVEFLSAVGRMTGEHDMTLTTMPMERESASEEIASIMADTPPGSPGYNSPKVQQRLQKLHEIVAGNKAVA
jgi:hypothetical protein